MTITTITTITTKVWMCQLIIDSGFSIATFF